MLPVLPATVCFAAVAALLIAEQRESQRGTWLTKPLASAAFVWTALESGAMASTYGQWVLLGLLLCLVGDLLLIPRGRPNVFRGGVAAFLLGHVAYSVAFLGRPLAAWGLALGAVLLAGTLAMVWRWLRDRLPADMNLAVRAYLVVIAVMATLACGVTAAGGARAVAVGALAFTASDISVARDRFVCREFANRAWGLPLYYAAQVLLALSPALG